MTLTTLKDTKKMTPLQIFLTFFCDFTLLHDKTQTPHHHLIHSTAPPAALIAHYNTHYILHTQRPHRTPRQRQKHATSTPKAHHTTKRLFTHNRVALQRRRVALWQRKSAAVEMPHATTLCPNTIFFAAKATLRHTRPQRRFGMS